MLLPYLELPVAVGYAGHDDKVVKGFFQPMKITHYHEGFLEVGIFIDGQPIQIALSIAQYEDQIQQYWNMLASQENDKNEKKSIKQKLGIVN